MSDAQIIPVSGFPGSIVVDDAGEEIGIQTDAGVVPFAGTPPAEGSTATSEAGLDEHDPLGVFAPPATAAEYELEVVDRDHAPELAAVQEAQTLFHEWGLDAVTASHLWRAAQLALAKPLTDGEIQLGAARIKADLVRRHGEEGAKAVIKRAQSEVARVAATRPEVNDWLNDTGLGNDWWLIERLAARAEIRAARGQDGTVPAATWSYTAPAGALSSTSVAQAQKELAQLQDHADFGKSFLAARRT